MAKVLLIEDDQLIVNVYSTYLKNEGHEVVSLFEGSQALQTAIDFQPGLILLDIMVPKLSGAQILEELRKEPLLANIPIIIYTNLSSEEKAREMLDKGATEFISKATASPREVIAKIQKYLQS